MAFSKTSFFSILLILTSASLFSQTESDLSSWTSLQFGYEIDADWELGLEGQLRLKSNISEVDEYFTEFSVKRKLFEGFRLGAAMRYIRENDNVGRIQGYENHFRYNVDANYKHKVGDIRLGYRLRYQNKNELGISEDEGDFTVSRIRFKTGLEYKINNWPLDPEFAGEVFSRFEKGENTKLDKYRLSLATSYRLKKAGYLVVYYRLESSIGKEIAENQHIIGLKYKYTFKSQ